MTLPSVLFSVITLFVISVSSKSSNIGLNTVELIKNRGYHCTTHHITTEDGYILAYHRIPQPNRPVVLLMHGISACSADYVTGTLAFVLADEGYDVWLANARGTTWSRNHTALHPEDDAAKFFDFSWHEIGYYDLPAAIDYILHVTQTDKLHYVGHSQGGAAFLVLATTRPEYNSKIRLASLMAPAAFMYHRKDVVKDLSQNIHQIEALLKFLQIYETPYVETLRRVTMQYCGNSDSFTGLCRAYFGWMGGGTDDEQLKEELMPVIGSNVPSNAAIKQFLHFGQLVKDGGFSFYDYGIGENLKRYGTSKPPTYNLTNVAAPVAIYYAKNDGVVPYKDVLNLAERLPNVVRVYKVPYNNFNHIDFAFAKDAYNLVFAELLKIIQNF